MAPDSEDLFEAKQFVKKIPSDVQSKLDVEDVAFVFAKAKSDSMARAKSYKFMNTILAFVGLFVGFLIGTGFGTGGAWIGAMAGFVVVGFAAQKHYEGKIKEEHTKALDHGIAGLLESSL